MSETFLPESNANNSPETEAPIFQEYPSNIPSDINSILESESF